MTLEELRASVALLGFETSLSALDGTAEYSFPLCVNRGLWTVNRLRPQIGQFTLHHYPAKNLLPYQNITHRGGVPVILSAFGAKAYHFSVTGTGYCILQDGDVETRLSWKNQSIITFSGHLEGKEATLSFGGEQDYTILSPALWNQAFSSEKDIPAGEKNMAYDLASLVDDFLRLDANPFIGQVPNGAVIDSGKVLWLSRECEGSYHLRYRKALPPVSIDTPFDTKLPLDEDLCQLLPLLVASYLCLDSDEDKAAYYYRLYEDSRRQMLAEPPSSTLPFIYSFNNW